MQFQRAFRHSQFLGIAAAAALVLLALPLAAAADEPVEDLTVEDLIVEEVTVDDVSRPELEEARAALVADAPEMVVTATRTRRDAFELPHSISVFDSDTIADAGSFVGVKAISRRDASIWYDERTFSTTDPIIRGLAGFNLLALVDGNTLTTLWGEGGFGADDMYGKLDGDMIERIEVIRGPNSALYGSNALGAVINVITRSSPYDFTESGSRWGARTKATFASVANARAIRQEVFGATEDFRFLLGGALRDFDDVEGGGSLQTLKPTDGRERNWDFSGEWRVDDRQQVRLTVQDVHRDHLKRYYRPTQDNVNDREAIAVFYERRGSKATESFRGSLYWQKKVDERRFFDTGDKGRATTETWQASLQSTSDAGDGHVITWGLQTELTDGDSPDDEQFTIVGPGPTMRAAPLSRWIDFGGYVQDEWAVDDDWSLTGAGRLDHQIFKTRVDSKYTPPIGDPRNDDIRDATTALTGGLGVVYKSSEAMRWRASWARGFRQNAPNFGIRQLGDGILIPNQLLDPTTSDNFELGTRGRWRGFTFDAVYYYSRIRNWQGDLRPTTFNGATFLDFDNDGSRGANEGYVTQVEGGDAWVQGIELKAETRPNAFVEDIPANWSLWASFAANEGRVDPTAASPEREPLRHTQPTRLLTGVRWDDVEDNTQGLYVEFIADMVNRYHKIPSDRRTSDLAWVEDPQDDTSGLLRSYTGTPGYTIFNLYAGIDVTDNATLRVAVENITNKKYRVAQSRMDAPGRNVVISLDVWF